MEISPVVDTAVKQGGFPAWINSVNSAVWITDPFGDISYINEKAETLLERSAKECIGRPCYQVICGLETSGKSYCAQICPALLQAQGTKRVDPVHMRIIGASGTTRWVQVIHILIEDSDTLLYSLVHCALDENRTHRIEAFLRKVYSRTPNKRAIRFDTVHFALTKREEQILKLLSNDETLHEIANSLHVSYATVRNHVHHILAKLGVHSIMEAVACYLLVKDD